MVSKLPKLKWVCFMCVVLAVVTLMMDEINLDPYSRELSLKEKKLEFQMQPTPYDLETPDLQMGLDLLHPIKTNANISSKTPEIRHMAFLKVHKTGSSSVQNLFLRYGESRNLTFILASKRGNECNRNLNCISFINTLYDGNIVPPPGNKSYDILCSHVIYNKTAFRRYLPRDTLYIGLVREPARRLESAIAHFRLFKGVSKREFAENAIHYQDAMSNNRMAFEFGFNKEWFPSPDHTTLSKKEKELVNKYVDILMYDFDLIMINERLDESIVLLRRLLGWSMQDMIYHRKNVVNHSSFTDEDVKHLKDYLYLDYMLYERSLEIHVARVAKAGDDFEEEVKLFQTINGEVNKYCGCERCMDTPLSIGATPWHRALVVTKMFCKSLSVNEIDYFKHIRIRQYGNKRNKIDPFLVDGN